MKIRSLKAAATAAMVDSNYSPRRLAVIYAGVTVAAFAALLILDYVITRNINAATGLAQLGNRAILSTVQSVLNLAVQLALPFWTIGFFRAALQMTRIGNGCPKDLLEGFRRWGPVFRLDLLQSILYSIIGILAFFIALPIILFTFPFTPLAGPMMEIMEPIMEEATVSGQLVIDDATATQLMPFAIFVYAIYGIVLAIMVIPVFYRFRMAQFAIMDDAPGALAALRTSNRILRRKCFFLFRLDLSFWWFYAAQALIPVLCIAGVVLSSFEVSLPVSQEVLIFAPLAIGVVLELVLAWCCMSYVQVTYAHCYDALKASAPPAPAPGPLPRTFPWPQQ